MSADDFWNGLRDRSESLDEGSALETPVSERRFRIVDHFDDRIEIRFLDSEEERPLWREQFKVLVDRLENTSVAVADLAPGVEPYVSVTTLAAAYTVDDGAIVRAPGETRAGESPYLVSPAEARTLPDRLHDDALLLAEHVDRLDVANPSSLDTDSLTDAYVLSSDVQRRANRLRTSVRDELLGRLGTDQVLHGRFGTVRRTTRERRSVRDEEVVFDALDEHDVPREWVMGIDQEKLDVVLSVTDVDEDDVYDVSENVYVQKTGVDEDEKYELLAGVRDRLADLEGANGAQLREELTDIESRIDEALGAD